MNMVKNVGSKLDEKLKSGEIKESELMKEASELMEKMKNMPGMKNMDSLLSKMGIPGVSGRKDKCKCYAIKNETKYTSSISKGKNVKKIRATKKRTSRNGSQKTKSKNTSISTCCF